MTNAIGRYLIVRELGRGGMGVAYEVRQAGLERRLALKLSLSQEPEARARFLREGELLARIRHPNVVQVHELGEVVEGPYLVTELVEGEDLTSARGRPLDPEQAARITRDLADALETVHAAGILHRDLKPANVILRPDGVPLLLDFGVARDQHGEQLTQTGTVVGTLAYMSPEQAGGLSSRQLNARTDVYGLGATLLFLLSGEPPFAREGQAAMMKAVLMDEPAWPVGVPAPLEAILRKAMAKERLDRYPTAGALRDDLDRYLRGAPPLARPPRKLPALRLAIAAATGVALLAVGAVILAGRTQEPGDESTKTKQSAAPPPTEKTEPLPSKRRPWKLPHARDGSWWIRGEFLPDERVVTWGSGPKMDRGEVRIWALAEDGQPGRPERIPVPGSVDALAVLPDGGLVVTAAVRVFETGKEQSGGSLASQVRVLRLQRKPPYRHQELLSAGTDTIKHLAASPDGRWLAMTRERRTGNVQRHVVRLLDLRQPGSKPRDLGAHPHWIHDLKWRGNGELLSCSGRAGTAGGIGAGGDSSRWSLAKGRQSASWPVPNAQGKTILPLPGGRYLVGTSSKELLPLRAGAKRLARPGWIGIDTVSRIKGFGSSTGAHNGTLRASAITPDGRWVITVSGDWDPRPLPEGNEVRAWDPASGENVGGVKRSKFPLIQVAASARWVLLGLWSKGQPHAELWPLGLVTRPGLRTYASVWSSAARASD